VARLHNETCNIWSHVLGFFGVLMIGFYFFPGTEVFAKAPVADKVFYGIFLAAALKCLAASSVWHTFNSIACVRTMRSFACLDYTAISALISCTIITLEYAGYYCQPKWRAFYIGVTALFGLFGSSLPWCGWFDRKSSRGPRVLFFIGLSASGMIPVLHQCFERGLASTGRFYQPIVKSLAAYLIGVAFYTNRFPERVWKGMFDWVGGSHTIWHICVVLGIVLHYRAMNEIYAGAHAFACSLA
jgi:adiponectin receptor